MEEVRPTACGPPGAGSREEAIRLLDVGLKVVQRTSPPRHGRRVAYGDRYHARRALTYAGFPLTEALGLRSLGWPASQAPRLYCRTLSAKGLRSSAWVRRSTPLSLKKHSANTRAPADRRGGVESDRGGLRRLAHALGREPPHVPRAPPLSGRRATLSVVIIAAAMVWLPPDPRPLLSFPAWSTTLGTTPAVGLASGYTVIADDGGTAFLSPAGIAMLVRASSWYPS